MKLRTLPIFLCFFVMGFVDVVGTLVSFAKREFHLSSSQASLLPFFGFIAFAVFSVPAGVLAEKYGKKALLIGSLALVVVGQLIPSLALSTYGLLLGAIFLIGIGMAALQVAGNPIMRDVSAPGRFARNLTFAQFIKSLGSIAGPWLAGAITLYGFAWFRIFPVFAAVTALTLLCVALLRVPEAERQADAPKVGIGASFALLREPSVALAVGGIFLYVGAEVGLNSWLAELLANRFHLDLGIATQRGPGLFFIALACGRLLGSAVLNFMGARRFFLVTTLIGLAGLLALFARWEPLVVGGIVLCGIGFANVWPLVFALTVESRPEHSGALSGLMCMAIVGGALLPGAMGAISDSQGVAVGFAVPTLCFLYLALLAVAMQRQPARTAT
jgi:FHS family L-fucose permease-like MFS transporter